MDRLFWRQNELLLMTTLLINHEKKRSKFWKKLQHRTIFFNRISSWLRDFPTTSDHASDSSSIPEEETLGEELVLFFFFFFSLKYSFFTALYGSLWFQSAFLKNFRVFSLVCTLLKTWRRKIAVIKSCIRSNRSVCVCARVSYSETMIVAASRFSHHGRIDDRFFFFLFSFFILKTLDLITFYGD